MRALLGSQLEIGISLFSMGRLLWAWTRCKRRKLAPFHKGMEPKLNFYIDSLLGELTKQIMHCYIFITKDKHAFLYQQGTGHR